MAIFDGGKCRPLTHHRQPVEGEKVSPPAQHLSQGKNLRTVGAGQGKHHHRKDTGTAKQFEKRHNTVEVTASPHIIVVLAQSLQAHLIKFRPLDGQQSLNISGLHGIAEESDQETPIYRLLVELIKLLSGKRRTANRDAPGRQFGQLIRTGATSAPYPRVNWR